MKRSAITMRAAVLAVVLFGVLWARPVYAGNSASGDRRPKHPIVRKNGTLKKHTYVRGTSDKHGRHRRGHWRNE